MLPRSTWYYHVLLGFSFAGTITMQLHTNMSKQFYTAFINTVSAICAFGMRQGKTARKASVYIQKRLKKAGIPFQLQVYTVALPAFKQATLMADGVFIPCLPTSFMSGEIANAYALTSSLISSKHFFDIPHINFNPLCRGISRPNFSNAPSVAIGRDDILRISKAKKVYGKVIVSAHEENVDQILVGNIKNPEKIVFSHFDSIGPGAVDNASGTALCLELLIEQPHLLDRTLFVFDGNEELSYNRPQYWGKGYRNFQKTFPKVMEQAIEIVVVDCIGYAPTEVICGGPIISLAFPITNSDVYADRITLLTSSYDKLMSVYHAELDVVDTIKKTFVDEARDTLDNLLSG